jgi:threonine synthase
VQIAEPVRAQPLVERVRESGGLIMAVSEPDLEHGHRELRKRGLDVEATSALVWSAIKECAGKYPGPVIAVLTGHGLKEPDGQGSG